MQICKQEQLTKALDTGKASCSLPDMQKSWKSCPPVIFDTDITDLMLADFAFKSFHLWFISSSRCWSIVASSEFPKAFTIFCLFPSMLLNMSLWEGTKIYHVTWCSQKQNKTKKPHHIHIPWNPMVLILDPDYFRFKQTNFKPLPGS